MRNKIHRRSFLSVIAAGIPAVTLAAYPELKWGKPVRKGPDQWKLKISDPHSYPVTAQSAVLLICCVLVVVCAIGYLVYRTLKSKMDNIKVCPNCGRPQDIHTHKCPFCGFDFDHAASNVSLDKEIITHHIEVMNPHGVEVAWYPVLDHIGPNFDGLRCAKIGSQDEFESWVRDGDALYEPGADVYILSRNDETILTRHTIEIEKL